MALVSFLSFLKLPFVVTLREKQCLLIMDLLGIYGLLLPALLCPRNQLWLQSYASAAISALKQHLGGMELLFLPAVTCLLLIMKVIYH